MKKLLTLAAIMCASAAFAAFDLTSATPTLLVAPKAISANATNTVEFTSAGRKGTGEIYVAATSSATNGTIAVTLMTTNVVAGGWSVFAAGTYPTAPTNAVYALPVAVEYLSPVNRLLIAPTGANTTASAILLSY
ncbi:MAG: hypothetical protein II265_07615 [Clostridia bacterium]|nr:hypothetical protein [Clostridia bacterium]